MDTYFTSYGCEGIILDSSGGYVHQSRRCDVTSLVRTPMNFSHEIQNEIARTIDTRFGLQESVIVLLNENIFDIFSESLGDVPCEITCDA